jgi:hypothetical protein
VALHPREEYGVSSLFIYRDFAYAWMIIVTTVVNHDVGHLQLHLSGNSPVALGSCTDVKQYRIYFNFTFRSFWNYVIVGYTF